MLIWARRFPLVQPAMATFDALLFKHGALAYCDSVKYGAAAARGPAAIRVRGSRGQELDTVWTMRAGLSVWQSGEERATACNSGPELRPPGHAGVNTLRNPLVTLDTLP